MAFTDVTSFLFRKQRVEITTQLPAVPGGVRFDASVSETHNDQSEIVSHPVESGIGITDHIRRLPRSLEISEVVTNTPVILLPSVQSLLPRTSPVIGATRPSHDRVNAAYEKLREMHDSGVLVTVKTSLRSWSNMAIESLSVRRDYTSGNILDITITLREIQLALAASVDVPVPAEKEKHPAEESNEGKKEKNAPSQKKQDAGNGSLANQAAEKLMALF